MDYSIVKQPNGLYACWLEQVSDFLYLDLSHWEAFNSLARAEPIDRIDMVLGRADANYPDQWGRCMQLLAEQWPAEKMADVLASLSQTKPIFFQAAEKLGAGYVAPLEFGPAHVVWSDYNFDLAEWCLENFPETHDNATAEQLAIVKWSLEELVKIPMERRLLEAGMFQGVEEEESEGE